MNGSVARSAFINGMGLGLRTGAIVALVGAAVALAILPGREPHGRRRSRATPTPRPEPKHSPRPVSRPH